MSVLSFLLAAGLALEGPTQFEEPRAEMVKEQLMTRDITDTRVLDAMRTTPRHEFVPDSSRGDAYRDSPLPIGHGQTISQPYIVALMTQLLAPKPTDRILEIGTGSGYQAAVLAPLVKEVFTIEIIESLADRARATLTRLGIENVHIRTGDGYQGWPEEAPFDAIIVTCAPDHVPQPLVVQLREGGRLVIPVGAGTQELVVLRKVAGTLERESVIPVRFVPMTGQAED